MKFDIDIVWKCTKGVPKRRPSFLICTIIVAKFSMLLLTLQKAITRKSTSLKN